MSMTLVGAMLVGVVGPAAAQTPGAQGQAAPLPFGRLTVRPHAMVLGTHTATVGEQSLSQGVIYVPGRCVGMRRCPLLVMGGNSRDTKRDLEREADRYGILVLWVIGVNECRPSEMDQSTVDPGVRDLVRAVPDSRTGCQHLDALLTAVLQSFAIDPDKIAISGNSDGGGEALFLGRTNPEVFSRIVPTSPALEQASVVYEGADPPNPRTQFYITGGTLEPGLIRNVIAIAQRARRDGLPAVPVLLLRGHSSPYPEAVASFMRWLSESWEAPAATARREAARLARARAGPLLTVDAVERLATFWNRFAQDSFLQKEIRDEDDTTYAAYIKEYPVQIGREPMLLLMPDLPAIAARYPSVAAALRAAGLTAQQAEAYRLAVLSAQTTLELVRITDTYLRENVAGIPAPTSVLGQNMALLAVHPWLVEQFHLSMWGIGG